MRWFLSVAAVLLALTGHALAYPAGVLTCNPTDRSFTTATGAVVILPANPTRTEATIQVPATLTAGLWLSWVGTASAGGSGSVFYPAGSTLTLEPSVIGLHAVTGFTTTTGQVVPVIECAE